jgi:hypothetical protein
MLVAIDADGAASGEEFEHDGCQFLVATLVGSVVLERTSLPLGEGHERAAGERGKILAVTRGRRRAAGQRGAFDRLIRILDRAGELPWPIERADLLALLGSVRAVDGALQEGDELAVAFVDRETLTLTRLGDCRCLLFRGGNIARIVESSAASGSVTTRLVDLAAGDRLFLAVGASDLPTDSEVGAILAESGSATEACRSLMRGRGEKGFAAVVAYLPA